MFPATEVFFYLKKKKNPRGRDRSWGKVLNPVLLAQADKRRRESRWPWTRRQCIAGLSTGASGLQSAGVVSVFIVSVDAMQHWTVAEVGQSQLRTCVKVEVDVLGSPSLIVRTVSVDEKQHRRRRTILIRFSLLHSRITGLVGARENRCQYLSRETHQHTLQNRPKNAGGPAI